MRRILTLLTAMMLTSACAASEAATVRFAADGAGGGSAAVSSESTAAPEESRAEEPRRPSTPPGALPSGPMDPPPIDAMIAAAAREVAPAGLRPAAQEADDAHRLVLDADGGIVYVVGQRVGDGDRAGSAAFLTEFGEELELDDGPSVLVQRRSTPDVRQMRVLVGSFQFNVVAQAARPGQPAPLTDAELERYATAIAARLG